MTVTKERHQSARAQPEGGRRRRCPCGTLTAVHQPGPAASPGTPSCRWGRAGSGAGQSRERSAVPAAGRGRQGPSALSPQGPGAPELEAPGPAVAARSQQGAASLGGSALPTARPRRCHRPLRCAHRAGLRGCGDTCARAADSPALPARPFRTQQLTRYHQKQHTQKAHSKKKKKKKKKRKKKEKRKEKKKADCPAARSTGDGECEAPRSTL
ncbi:uncharacterized protein LOC141730645 [Zonotrichia albicollis]|uniref:uncharacterized protein LOC141730645 n=1 Tax=Zonotrichia albicollis TaxID=44394 RepID=UPI003D80B90D